MKYKIRTDIEMGIGEYLEQERDREEEIESGDTLFSLEEEQVREALVAHFGKESLNLECSECMRKNGRCKLIYDFPLHRCDIHGLETDIKRNERGGITNVKIIATTKKRYIY